MLIKALNEYYDILADKGKVTPDGYTAVKVDYMICLTPDGDIEEILDWREKREVTDKKGKIKTMYFPREELLPERSQKPGIDLNIIEHRPLYIFGLNYEKEDKKEDKKEGFTQIDKTNKAMKSHDIFVKGNIEFIDGIDQPVVNAYRNFLQRWEPEKQVKSPHLLKLGKDYNNSKYIFCLSGEADKPLHRLPAIKERWNKYYSAKYAEKGQTTSQCAVTGQIAPIARIHDKIKGIKGGQASGGVLVSYKNDSETSYNKQQSYNSNICESVMKKYTEALNILLKDALHTTVLDDMTVVHWAQSVNNEKFDILMNWMAFDDKVSDYEMDLELKGIFNHLKNGLKVDFKSINIDENTEYYIAGMTPNNSRISVKFVYKEKFGNVLINAVQHQKDMAIGDSSKQIPLWKIKNELISPKSKDEKLPPPLAAEIFRSIVFGTDYPGQFLSTVVRRVKADTDTENSNFVKINATRAGIIKACINRRLRIYKKEEEIKMSLDTKNTNPAYLCGRLFAVLEKIQEKASTSKLNKTIKDTYFASACSVPAIVFPRLLILAQNHLPKIEYETYWNRCIGEIMNILGCEFPQTLSLTEQGMFIIGYYQQYYNKKEKDENKEVNEDGNH